MTTKFQLLCSCIKCRRQTTTTQLSRSHKDSCPLVSSPVRYPGNFGRQAWNKGLTKDTNDIVNKAASTLSKKYHDGLILAKEKSPEEIARLSKWAKDVGLGGYRENAGRSKKYIVIDSFGKQTTLQSSYEYECFQLLMQLSIRWIRPKALKYNGRNYFADFYLVDYDIYLDPKNNYKAKIDSDKIHTVQEQNNVKVIVLLKEQLNSECLRSILDMQSLDKR